MRRMHSDVRTRLDGCSPAAGLRQNTLVFFCNDNGMNMGQHGIFGKGSGTFPQNTYDTSVTVPATVGLPGRVPQGQVDKSLRNQ